MSETSKLLGERLGKVLELSGLSQSELARHVGMKPQGIQSIVAGDVKRPKKLREIAAATFTTEAYLLGETDDPSRPPELTRVPVGQEFPHDPDFAPDGHKALSKALPYAANIVGASPEIDAKPGAGLGTVGQTFAIDSKGIATGHRVIAEWVFPPDYLRHELGTRAASVVVMEVVGDSMKGTLESGDRVLVDMLQNTFGADAVYVIDDGDGEPRVKRLEKILFSSPPAVAVISDNPASHREEKVELAQLRIVGRVVGRVTRM